MSEIKCCPECNYAISKKMLIWSRYDYPCPNCWLTTISHFYSLGSMIHKSILDGTRIQNAIDRLSPWPWPWPKGVGE